jgi:PKD repeat protein
MRRLARLSACLLAAFTTVSTAAEPTGDWSRIDSPNSQPTPAGNLLTGITCAAADDCWSVGWYQRTAGATQTLIEHWDGSAWSVVSSPNSAVSQGNLLRAVACAAADDCWAVGSYNDGSVQRTLALHWDGAAWSLAPTPNTDAAEHNALVDVACVAGGCWAVGNHTAGGVYQTLILRWDGSDWSIAASPDASATANNLLSGVTCVAAGDCWAVGSAVDGNGTERTLVERWNGSAWTIVASPHPLLASASRLAAVECTAATNCWAVGSTFNGAVDQTLIQSWDGSAWTTVSSPNSGLAETNVLRNVSCAAAADCWAVGDHGATAQPLAVRWNGSSWAVAASPSTDAAQPNHLFDVDCVAAGACRAAGWRSDGTLQQTLIQHWSGSAWGIVASANANAAQNNTLLGVHCMTPADCWAVASYNNGSVQQTLIQRWDGAAWSLVDSPNTDPGRSNILYDVACVAADDCWAVGYAATTLSFQPLLLHWDGAAWTLATAPTHDGGLNHFVTSIDCVSASLCWAVGYYDTGPAYQTLMLRWDGGTWTVAASPNADPTRENRVWGVACAAADECWAVGRHFDGTAYLTLATRWDGTAWSIVDSPNADGAPDNNLQGVACAGPGDCWAVGNWGVGSGTAQPLIQHWDGSAWRIVAAPLPTEDPQYNYNFLRNAACASAADCWAIGYSFQEGAYRTLALHWDGAAWRRVATPNTGATQNNYLIGLSCTSAYHCWSTGYRTDDAGVFETLTVRYVAAAPPVTAQLTATPDSGFAPLLVTLDAAGSAAPAGATYRFDFGDGSLPRSGTDVRVTHLYASAGAFTATVTVTDPGDAGNQAQASATVQVALPQPTTAQLTVTPATVQAGSIVTLDASGSQAGDGAAITSYTFDFGDGSAPVTQDVAVLGAQAARIEHAYVEAGAYNPGVTVTDSAGGVAEATAALVIEPVPTARPQLGDTAPAGGAMGGFGLLMLLAGLRRIHRRRQ